MERGVEETRGGLKDINQLQTKHRNLKKNEKKRRGKERNGIKQVMDGWEMRGEHPRREDG